MPAPALTHLCSDRESLHLQMQTEFLLTELSKFIIKDLLDSTTSLLRSVICLLKSTKYLKSEDLLETIKRHSSVS